MSKFIQEEVYKTLDKRDKKLSLAVSKKWKRFYEKIFFSLPVKGLPFSVYAVHAIERSLGLDLQCYDKRWQKFWASKDVQKLAKKILGHEIIKISPLSLKNNLEVYKTIWESRRGKKRIKVIRFSRKK